MAGAPPLTALADTGAVYALLDRDDVWHDRVKRWWEAATEAVLLPITIVPEASYLIGRWLGAGAERAFVQAIADGQFTVEPLDPDDFPRAADLMGVYLDAPLGFVDASVVAVGERLGIVRLLTTDRRHFALVRPRHLPAFELLP
ncbi:MAG: PIN domain-containing protein [Gemmatimonadetes bacterium]|nr:PIN domain-containing protein [Gemmatimonadota bacterium]